MRLKSIKLLHGVLCLIASTALAVYRAKKHYVIEAVLAILIALVVMLLLMLVVQPTPVDV